MDNIKVFNRKIYLLDKIKDSYGLYLDERYFTRKKFIFVYLSGFGAGLASGLIGLGAVIYLI